MVPPTAPRRKPGAPTPDFRLGAVGGTMPGAGALGRRAGAAGALIAGLAAPAGGGPPPPPACPLRRGGGGLTSGGAPRWPQGGGGGGAVREGMHGPRGERADVDCWPTPRRYPRCRAVLRRVSRLS